FTENSPLFIDGKKLSITQPASAAKTHDMTRLRGEKQASSFFGAIHNMAKKAYERMSSVASKVKDTVNFAAMVFELIVTGDMNYQFSDDVTVVNYHYDTDSNAATCTFQLEDVFGEGTEVTGTCDNCYA